MRTRLAVPAAALALAALASPGHAGPFSYTDPAGDSIGAQAGLDVVSVTYGTTGTTRTEVVRGKRVARYTPTKLVVTLKLAGAVVQQPGVTYEVDAQTSTCGFFELSYSAGTLYAQVVSAGRLFMECGSPPDETGSTATLINASTKVSGSTLAFTVPLGTLPKAVKAGTVFTEFAATTEYNDPLLASEGMATARRAGLPVAFDEATSTGRWTLG